MVNKLTGGQQIQSNRFIQQNKAHLVPNILPGYMFSFVYDPKGKDTLPVYDTFPLILPFNKRGEHFWGLNLHYLPPNLRFALLTKLLQFANNKAMAPDTKLVMSWKLIGHSSKLPEVKPCVKQYLISHVRSKFLQIPPIDWMTAVLLPTQQFRGDKPQNIWKRSRDHVNSHT